MDVLGLRSAVSGGGSLKWSSRHNNSQFFKNDAFVPSIAWRVLILLIST